MPGGRGKKEKKKKRNALKNDASSIFLVENLVLYDP